MPKVHQVTEQLLEQLYIPNYCILDQIQFNPSESEHAKLRHPLLKLVLHLA